MAYLKENKTSVIYVSWHMLRTKTIKTRRPSRQMTKGNFSESVLSVSLYVCECLSEYVFNVCMCVCVWPWNMIIKAQADVHLRIKVPECTILLPTALLRGVVAFLWEPLCLTCQSCLSLKEAFWKLS